MRSSRRSCCSPLSPGTGASTHGPGAVEARLSAVRKMDPYRGAGLSCIRSRKKETVGASFKDTEVPEGAFGALLGAAARAQAVRAVSREQRRGTGLDNFG
jgi:hypothetical protein